jgi:hypothetical protein
MMQAARERRRFQRIDPGDQAFVVCRGDGLEKVCQIIDISREGLCFRYFDRDVDTTVARMLDLYFIPHNVVLRQLAFSVVYENKEIGRNPFSALFMARVGVGFTTMASSCQSLLEEILSAFSNEDRPEHSFPVARHVPRYSFLKAF